MATKTTNKPAAKTTKTHGRSTKDRLGEWVSAKWFSLVHGRNLVYNACWEDPRIDRQVLELKPDDVVLVITSAGCNALDYALDGPAHIHAVDMNPRQNALLDLKIAGIRNLDFDTFFEMFGGGRLRRARDVYKRKLRADLPQRSQRFWDRRIATFGGKGWRDSFYFHGTSGMFARIINHYIDRVAKVRTSIDAIFEAGSLKEQKRIYDEELRDAFWNRFIRWAIRRDAALAMLGVPRAQRHQIDRTYPGGVAKFIEDSIETVFTKLPLADNYFWRLYLEGRYTFTCCPEYLKPESFARLKSGLVDRITTHTDSILDFLHSAPTPISRFVLLDHMDWLSTNLLPILRDEWQAIIDHAAPNTRILWRSGGLTVDFVDPIQVKVGPKYKKMKVGELLRYHPEWAAKLHEVDRVHTYGSFYIADLELPRH